MDFVYNTFIHSVESKYFLKLFENSSDIITILNEDGIILYQSPAAEKQIGWNFEDEIKNTSIFDLCHKEDKKIVELELKRLLHNQNITSTFSYRYKDKDSNWRYFESIGRNMLQDKDIGGIILTTRDITARIEREKKLLETEEKYKAFIETSTQAIWKFEVTSPIAMKLPIDEQIKAAYNYAFLAECNETMAKMYGYESSQQLIGARLSDLLPKDVPENIEYLRNFIKSNYKLTGAESHEIDKDGNIKYFENSLIGVVEEGYLVRAWGSQIDITERKKTQDSLHKILESVPHIIWTATPEGKIDYTNDRWSEYTGLTIDEIRTQGWSKIIHPDDLPRCLERWQRAFKEKRGYEIEYRIKRGSDGRYRWFLSKIEPLKDSRRDVVKWFGSCTDIHERKTAHEKENFLSQLNKVITSSLEIERTIQNLADTIVPNYADLCTVTLLDPDTEETKIAVAHSQTKQNIKLKKLLKEYLLLQNESHGVMKVIKSGKAEFIPELTPSILNKTIRDKGYNEFLTALKLHSYICVPLNARGRTIGAITFIYTGSERTYTTDDLLLVTEVTERTSIALDNALLYDEAQKELQKRKQIELEIIRINSKLEHIVNQRTQQLQKVQERFYDIFESSKDGIMYATLDGNFVDINPAFSKITGFSREELTAMDFQAITPVKYQTKEQSIINSLIQTGEPVEYEKQFVTSNGKNVDVSITAFLVLDKKGKPAGLAGIVKDITELKKSRKAFKASEERNRSIIASMQEGIIFHDKYGTIKDCNISTLKILECSKEELLNCSSITLHGQWKIINIEGVELVEDELPHNICLSTCKPLSNFIIGLTKENHPPVWISVNSQPIFKYNKKKVFAVVSSYSVITDEKESEDKLRELNLQLERSNKELQDFASVASHDLQEPLRKVQTFGDRLKATNGAVLTDEGKDYLERMLNAAGRMRGLIQDLLTFSRVTTKAQPFEKVNLNKVAEEVLSDLEISAEEAGAIITLDHMPTIEGDPTQLRQLLQNLISNALKFKKKDIHPIIDIRSEIITVRTKTDEGFKKEERCTIIVKDNGIGFDEKYTDRIFNVFQRLHTREEYEGTGVGLAVCRKIAERHGGSITAKSVIGKGSEFIITLPLKQNK